MNPIASMACALLLVQAVPAEAGRSCEDKPLDVATVQQAMGLAERTAKQLDASGAQVVLLAREGQDLSRYGLTWSHLGLAYRESPTTPWRVVHKLNTCGTAVAAVYRQGLGEFFLDRLWRYEAAIVIPTPEVQAKLLPVLSDNRRSAQWHTAPYSMVSYAWGLSYQQSNQWALETMAGAIEPAATTRQRAQSWLQLHDYQPTALTIGPLTRLGGRMSQANIAFDDHPNAKRFSDRIETVTVDSVFRWIERSHLGGEMQVVQ